MESDTGEVGVLDIARKKVEQSEDFRAAKRFAELGKDPLASTEGRTPVMDDRDRPVDQVR